MSLKKTSKRGHSTMNELNITPLLDLVFVLLVIFIITTPQLVNNLEINLPSGKKPPADHKPKPPTRIDVTAAGQITLDDTVVTVPQLKDKLQALKSANPELGVVVKGADEVDYQVMVNVMDTLRQLDITKMGLATE
jgi:biopolymer transport protein ExbD